ncbi:MAG: tyrosine-type recombinase/integrase [Dehalococcoidia bacterium]
MQFTGTLSTDVDTFLHYLAQDKGYSKNTLAAYRNDLTQMAAFIAAERAQEIGRSFDEILKGYLLKLRENRYSAATTARKIASARSFFRFMTDSGRMNGNPMQDLPSPHVGRHSIKFLSLSEFERLVAEAAKLTTPEAKRDVVMLELLHGTGLRITELVSLDVGDIDTGRRHVNVGSSRQVPLDARLASLLAGFLRSDRLDLLYDESEQALFLNQRGKRLTRQGLWQIIKEHASRAGLGDKVTPQTLRHSFARHRLQNGTDLRELQQLLGHAYISSTRIYRQSPTRQG